MRLMRFICVVTMALTAACSRPPFSAPAQVVTNSSHSGAHPKSAQVKPKPVAQAAPTVAVTATDLLTPEQKEDLFNRFDAWQASHGPD